MYVMCLYQALPHKNLPLSLQSPRSPGASSSTSADFPMEGLAEDAAAAAVAAADFSAYQTLMEEVLVWLLAAEDLLDSSTAVDEATSQLAAVKQQFHKHEEFLLELTSQQGSVGAVLNEGQRLLQSGSVQLTADESAEIRMQMKLLNSRWEQLRTIAMDRQAWY